jgi:hypothetical protein
MGINNVAIKTFSSTGAQSVCRSNAADSSKLIESQFITRCKNEYINGSGMSVISGKTFSLTSAVAPDAESFRIPNDCDAISDIILQMRVELPLISATSHRIHSKTFLLDLINKVEIFMGGILIQTIRPGDIYVRNSTELNEGVKYNQPRWTSIQSSSNGLFYSSETSSFPAFTLDFALSVPFPGRDKRMKHSFLNAGAYTNSLTVKVTYNKYTLSKSLLARHTATIDVTTVETAETCTATTSLAVFSHNITETEKNFIQSNIINRVINTSQSVVPTVIGSSTTTASPKISIPLTDLSINVSHILICLYHPLFVPAGTLIGNFIGGVGGSAAGVGYQAGSSVLPLTNLGSAWSEITQIANGSAMPNVGVPSGWLQSAELIIGSDRTGEISGSSLLANNLEGFGLTYADNKGIYIFKTAETAFSTAGIAFSKCNSVQLVLTLNASYITAMTSIFNLTYNGPTISVTACGTQIQTTVGGSISFSS